VVSEEAFLAWAEEKEHAEADERVYLDQVRKGGGGQGQGPLCAFLVLVWAGTI
jgi:hypothetical protein